MTREQLLASLAAKRARSILLTWAQFTGGITALDTTTKALLLEAANGGNGKTMLAIINGVVQAQKTALARAEVDAAAADDNLTIDELIALLS